MIALHHLLSGPRIQTLVTRLDLVRQILTRDQEEAIASIVPIDQEWLSSRRSDVLGDRLLQDYLSERSISETDFISELWLPQALMLFSQQHLGSALEESYLSLEGALDVVVYSFLRVKDFALARELWLRLEEGESSFAALANQYSEGPEKERMGIMGPVQLSAVHPIEFRERLRLLKVGELTSPFALGEWHILIRLEQYTPSKYDDETRSYLLKSRLNKFISHRVDRMLSGQPLEPLSYDVLK